MTRTIEAVFENTVLKPLEPIKGFREHEKMTIILCPHPRKGDLRKLVGTLTHEEAEEMRKSIGSEFERVEGEW